MTKEALSGAGAHVSILECDLIGRLEDRSTITLLLVALEDRHFLSVITAARQICNC